MTEPLISVIIPVYNSETFLDECLSSIAGQRNRNFEAIMVNDGSTDSSADICRRYAEEDSRFILIEKENGGVSSARNAGLEAAKGRYILFADSDDYMSEDYLSLNGEEMKYDIIQKSFTEVFHDGTSRPHCIRREISIFSREDIFRTFAAKKTNAIWNKIFSSGVIGSCRFDETLHIGEDLIFFITVMQNAESYRFSATGQYFYRIHAASAMQKMETDVSRVIDSNLSLARHIASASVTPGLGETLVARIILLPLFRKRKQFSAEQRKKYFALSSGIKASRLKYLPLGTKLKFLARRLIIHP